ncbi:MAG: hypothetical protein E7293_08145 [Lachnospiraceae bacterium]|nr:hypothetical protein [Lachnospiraceae bacterium]
MKELNYDFRKEMLQVHEKDIRNTALMPEQDELVLEDGVNIVIDSRASEVIETAAWDLSGYLYESMNVSAMIKKGPKAAKGTCIYVALAADTGEDLGEYASYKGYRVTVEQDCIRITGYDDRGAAAGIYRVEEIMTDRKAPYVKQGVYESKPMFSPCMVHSGYGLDEFPNEHLQKIAHEGRDAILVYTRGAHEVMRGFSDMNDIIRRAAKYGIDVYAYSFMRITVHPEDPGADAQFENTYGKLFDKCPGLKGVTLVGESVGFPSKDEHVVGTVHNDTIVDGIPTGKVSPGWYPCYDYPLFVNKIKEVIRKRKPDADIVFWTYNWGYQPEEARIKMINNLPTDITLLATFEMIAPYQFDNGAVGYCADYTLAFEGPGHYFASEAKAAKARGIKLYSMTNTGGLTWDFGCIPYQPMPNQWIKRFQAVIKAHDDWNLCGLMECHHYGFYPSFISKLGKRMFSEPRGNAQEILDNILVSEFGSNNLEEVRRALQLWSEAITYYVPTDADQYGACRIGPSYPLCVGTLVPIPAKKFANMYCVPNYLEGNKGRDSHITMRIGEEIKLTEKMKELFDQGLVIMDGIQDKNAKLEKLLNMGHFLSHCMLTCINAKKMFRYRCKLKNTESREELLKLVDEIEVLVRLERENAETAIPFVQKDSRLGWEPRMDYSTDEDMIRWKLRHSDYVLNIELPTYRKGINFDMDMAIN